MRNVTVKVGDMFESNAQTLVNTVNCVGIMGKGIALQFKTRFPNMYREYVKKCERHEVRLGHPYLYRDLIGKWILNFPTKDHWRSVSKLSDIVEGLRYLERHFKEWGIKSLAVPPLGCGNGQLDWNVVGPTLYRHLSRFDIPVELFAPAGTPPEQLTHSFLSAETKGGAITHRESDDVRVSAAAVALVGIVSRINREPYHWPIGRTTFQKIAYFATESGLPTHLAYRRGSYGPFAPDLKRLVARLINNGLLTETKQGNMFILRPGPTYQDARERYRAELKEWTPIVERVADLFLRLRTTTDAEIAATVHFAARDLAAQSNASELDVLQEVKHWKARRRPSLSETDLASTIRYLNMLGWMDVKGSADLNIIEDELVA